MLRVNDIKDPSSVAIEIDPYVPIDITFSKYRDPSPLYWVCRNESSLLEVGINKLNGAITAITLVSTRRISVVGDNEIGLLYPLNCDREDFGVPSVDTFQWCIGNDFSSHFLYEEIVPVLMVGETRVAISFTRGNMAKVIRNECIYFYIDPLGNILGILIDNVNKKEIDTLKTYQ